MHFIYIYIYALLGEVVGLIETLLLATTLLPFGGSQVQVFSEVAQNIDWKINFAVETSGSFRKSG